MKSHSILWRRLDTPGHDACRFETGSSGGELGGTAVFRHNDAPARLSYHVMFDGQSRTRRGSVRGFVGTQVIDIAIERTTNGRWALNGAIVPGVEQYTNLDLGFTPATNFLQVPNLLRFKVGEGADFPVAWLDVPPSTLQPLHQRYERRGERTFWYEAPQFDFSTMLELTPEGSIRRYSSLWEAEG